MTVKEKLVAYGATGLGEVDLMAALIGSFEKGREEMRGLAESILAKVRIGKISKNDLMEIEGMSEELAESMSIALEIGRREKKGGYAITCPEDGYRLVRYHAMDNQENMIVIALNGAHEVIYEKSVTRGLMDRTIVHPREVFTDAIKERACAVMLAHNHPSGRIVPSDEDIALTKRLCKCGAILGIKVLDHLIITEKEYYSFLEHGYM